jgi:pyrroloquinoline quinone biosynthesis protein E
VRSVGQVVDQLAAKYAAECEAITTDVIAMLQDLAGFSHRGTREDVMSEVLTDQKAADPGDGLTVLEKQRSTAEAYGIPLSVLAELTHRCPLQCPYCSNPLELDRAASELSTKEWKKVLSQLAEIGVLQIHFSGGEPTARKDLVELIQYASDVGLYSNLITSAVLLTREKVAELADAGLAHVQISFQSNGPVIGDRVAGFRGAHQKKIEAAKWIREFDLPLTINAVMHRQNLHQLPDMIQMAVDLEADRLEVANVQYYGWALKNRAALMPTVAQLEETTRIVEEARKRLNGILAFDYVIPDYYALRPKKCMGGWGRQFFNISPSGKILPCHAAETITGLQFESVRSNHSIAWIWQHSEAFNRYRGTGWMPEPCKSCEFKEVDFGGCRCQAFALTGDAGDTDPACALSPMHETIFKQAQREAEGETNRFIYRNFAGGTPETGENGT